MDYNAYFGKEKHLDNYVFVLSFNQITLYLIIVILIHYKIDYSFYYCECMAFTI